MVTGTDSPYKTRRRRGRGRQGQARAASTSPRRATARWRTWPPSCSRRRPASKFQHVPYKGASQALTDVISGNVQLYMSSVPTLIGQIRQGKLRALAVTSAKRVDDLPNVPTLAEAGFKGFESVTWFGFLAPAGTPKDDRRPAQCRVQQGAAAARPAQEAGRRRRRHGRRHARTVRQADRRRHRPLGQGRQGLRRAHRLIAGPRPRPFDRHRLVDLPAIPRSVRRRVRPAFHWRPS